MFKHNLQSALVAADGIRKMDAVYEDAIEAHEPDLSELGKELWKVLQELVTLLAVNFMKICFPGFSVERVYGKIFLHDSSGSDLLSMYDGQINDGIIYREPSGVAMNIKENPEAILRILPAETMFYLVSYNEMINIDEMINRQHKIVNIKRDLAKICENFSKLPTIQDKALWLVTRRKLEQEIENLLLIDVSDKQQIVEENNKNGEEYYVDLDLPDPTEKYDAYWDMYSK